MRVMFETFCERLWFDPRDRSANLELILGLIWGKVDR